MPDSIDKLLINIAQAKLSINIAALNTHDKEITSTLSMIHHDLDDLAIKVNDQRIDAFKGTIIKLPHVCSDCTAGIKHTHSSPSENRYHAF